MKFGEQLQQKSTTVVSVPLFNMLTVAFVVLKLCNVINWSWWWVLSPLWIPPFAVGLAIVLVVFICLITVLCCKNRR